MPNSLVYSGLCLFNWRRELVSSEQPTGREKYEEFQLPFSVSIPCFSPHSYTIIPNKLEIDTQISNTPETHRLLFFKFNISFPNLSPTPLHIYMYTFPLTSLQRS